MSEVDIDEHFDTSDNLIQLNSIVLETWWAEIMEKTINKFMIYSDFDSKCTINITLIDSDEPAYMDNMKYDTEKPAYKILEHLYDLEEDKETLKICKTNGLDNLDMLSTYIHTCVQDILMGNHRKRSCKSSQKQWKKALNGILKN
ncbi:hypothetical protein WKT02_08750 [Erysipelotrichaceae bacterium HCN-30851]